MKATVPLTLATLVAFAANSLLCRAALRPGLVDAATFTSVRLLAGAVTLGILARGSGGDFRSGGSWRAALALFAYAAAFSFAYLRLDAGAGALILFGTVQATMIGWSLARGERPRPVVWLGLAVSLAGLVLLVRPGRGAPDAFGAALMALAGAAWGVYSLLGRGSARPIAENAGNFARSLPLVVLMSLAAPGARHASGAGLALAVTSGALTSGVGYAAWYAALRGLTATQAAIVQLAVPVFAASGGVLFLGESMTLRLAACGALVLGGIALAVTARPRA